jgi:hypothetical protein
VQCVCLGHLRDRRKALAQFSVFCAAVKIGRYNNNYMRHAVFHSPTPVGSVLISFNHPASAAFNLLRIHSEVVWPLAFAATVIRLREKTPPFL